MQKLKSTYMAIAAFAAAILLIFSSLFGVGVRLWASADVAEPTKFESQNVLDDLKNSVIGDKAFNSSDYPADKNGELKVLSFIEYCYASDVNRMGYYGLYLYVYNPRQIIFDFAKGRNTVQMRVGGGASDDYTKYPLEYLNCSVESAELAGLFYKFKITLTNSQRKEILDKLNPESRVYEISGVELMTYGGYTATDYPSYGHDSDGKPIGNRYSFSGFSAGYGSDTTAESTLKCAVDLFTSVELDVQHTFYRTKTSQKGAGYQVQLDTVYFSVPKALTEEYGKLQRIKAEWWEYKTKPIFVTSNNNFYNAAYAHIGSSSIKNCGWTKVDDSFGKPFQDDDYFILSKFETLYYLFDTEGSSISNYDPYADITASGGISSNRLYDYIKSYSYNSDEATVSIKNGQIASCLFQKDIDSSRKVENEYGKIQQGYSYYDFDIETDLQEIKTYNAINDFKKNEKMYGLWLAVLEAFANNKFSPDVEGWMKSLPPIQILTDKDIAGTSESERQRISDTLCVNYNDVEKLQSYYAEAQGKDEEVVLFRFATSDYYSKYIDIVKGTDVNFSQSNLYKGQVYSANQSVFFDFDVIQLAFSKEGITTVMAAVSSPIDIVNPVTPPYIPPNADWWKYALGIIVALAAVGVVYGIVRKKIALGKIVGG